MTHDRLTVWELMVLIAGVAIGLWTLLGTTWDSGDNDAWTLLIVAVLGGLSVVGPPLLIWERRRTRRPFTPGRFLWFTQGTAAWLLWPPVMYLRARGKDAEVAQGTAGMCFFYGTPLMAVYVTISLLVGGRLRRKHWRRARSWRERFGLLLALGWACTGVYLLAKIYREDLGR